MTNNSTFSRTVLFPAISVLLIFWWSVPFAAPYIAPLSADEVVVSNRLLNEILQEGAGGRAGTSEGVVLDTPGRVVVLMNAARSEILAALQRGKISGELEVRTGTYLSNGVVPGGSERRYISLQIFQNGNRLGNLQILQNGPSLDGSAVILRAEFTRVP
jgi:hypothetical protein